MHGDAAPDSTRSGTADDRIKAGSNPFPPLCPSWLASPSVEFSSVQGDVGIGVELALLLHVTFAFLWETATGEKMQQQGRRVHPIPVQPCHPAIPKTVLQWGPS